MPKTKRATSKRINSSTRHKIERKKREHKRDLRKAAKAMKAGGLGAKRSKKTREMAKLALKISNAHPDKEEILTKLLKAREAMRVQRASKKLQAQEEGFAAMAAEDLNGDKAEATAGKPGTRSLLFIPNSKQNDFTFQFTTTLEKLVFPLPTPDRGDDGVNVTVPNAAFLLTADSRCALQSLSWALLDAIVARGEEYANATVAPPSSTTNVAAANRKRSRNSAAPSTSTSNDAVARRRRVLVLIALTKCDLVSASAIGTQFSLLAEALWSRYASPSPGSSCPAAAVQGDSLELPGGIVFAFTPVSNQFEKTTKHLLRILRQFRCSQPQVPGAEAVLSNVADKLVAVVAGFPGTGRRSLMRALQISGTDSGVAVVPLRASVMQLLPSADGAEVRTKFVFPSAKEVTLVGLPEDHTLRKGSEGVAGDILFKSVSFVEKMEEPEHVAVAIVNSVADAVGLAQAFCQPAFRVPAAANETEEEALEREGRAVARFLQGIGHTVRREKGFHVCPLFVSSAGTAGRLGATSLSASTAFTSRQKSTSGTLVDASFSNATPSKLVRISSVVAVSRGKTGKRNTAIKRIDGHNAFKLGARTFLREFCQSRNVPWAILRSHTPLTQKAVEDASRIFSLAIFNGIVASASAGKAQPVVPASEHFTALLGKMTSLLKDYLVLLPHNVVEFLPSTVAPAQHSLDEVVEDEEEEEEFEEDDEENEFDDDEEEDEDD